MRRDGRGFVSRLFVVPDGSGFRCAIVGNGVDVAIVHGRTKRECAANASLVAAAPAMRTALWEARAALATIPSRSRMTQSRIDKIDAVLAKAEGWADD